MPHTIHHVIPEEERRCIWMDAGVAPYKLCDNEFQCATCEFDGQVRIWRAITRESDEEPRTPGSLPVTAASSMQTVEEMCAGVLDHLLGSIGATPLPADRLYAPDHTWAKKEADGSCTIGIDHFIGAMLAGIHSVACSLPSTHITAAMPCAWIVANGETLAVRSPLSGRVLECNPALSGPSDLLHADPYGTGWIVRIRPDEDAGWKGLRTKKETAAPLKKDCEKFRRSVATELHRMQMQLGGTMNDGGTVLDNFEDILGTKRYYEIVERFLGMCAITFRRR